MPTLSITKTYADGLILNEADLDNIVDDVETFINVTKLDNDNLQDLGIATSKLENQAVTEAKLGPGAVTETKLGALSVSTAKLQDNAVTPAKLDETGDYVVDTIEIGATPAPVLSKFDATTLQVDDRIRFKSDGPLIYKDTGKILQVENSIKLNGGSGAGPLLSQGINTAELIVDGQVQIGNSGGPKVYNPLAAAVGVKNSSDVIQGNIVLADSSSTGIGLKIVRGQANMTTNGVLAGEGFTVAKNSAGRATITFTNAFADVPSVTINCVDVSNDCLASLESISAASFIYLTSDATGPTSVDVIVSFQAIGRYI